MRHARPLTMWFVLLATLALLVVACGGDDGGGGSSSSGSGNSSASGNAEDEEPSEPLDEDEFLEEASDVCTGLTEDVQEVEDEADIEPGDFEEAGEVVGEDIRPLLEGAVEDFQAITPPEDLQEDYDEFVGLFEDAIGVAEDLQAAAEDGDQDAYDESAEDYQEVQDDVNAQAEDLEIACSEDLSDDLTSDFSDDFSDSSSDFSDDFSSDFSSDFSDDAGLGIAQLPSLYITDYGSDPTFDALADSCYDGNLADCDELYRTTPADPSTFSYEGYGATCGGRLVEAQPNQCEALG